MRRVAPLLLLCIALVGCDDLSDSLNREGDIQTLHAIPDVGQTSYFLRDFVQAILDYSDSTNFLRVATGNYPVRFITDAVNDNEPRTLLEFNAIVEADQQYTYVLTGTSAAPGLTTWQRDLRSFEDDTVLATQYGHVARTSAGPVGPLDFYLEAAGANLPGATPRASLSYGEALADVDLAPGVDYVLTLTTQGNVADILYQSSPVELTGATNVLFAALDGAGVGTAPFFVRVLGDPLTFALPDALSPPQLRAVHASQDTGAVDYFIDDEMLTSAFITNVSFKEVTGYQPNAPEGADLELDVTLTGDTNVLAEGLLTLVNGRQNSVYLVGTNALPSTDQLFDDNRRLADFAKLRIYSGVTNYSSVDVYLVPDGADYTLFFPTVPSLPFAADTDYLEFDPDADPETPVVDAYDVYVTAANSPSTLLAGPVDAALAAGDVSGIVIVDTDTTDTVDLVLLDDLAP
jgi:hypothetical protein